MGSCFLSLAVVTPIFIYAGLLTLLALPDVPRTLALIQPVFLLLLVGSSRALGRFWLSGAYLGRLKRGALTRVLIYGAGSSGHQLAVALANSMEMRAVGFLDDDEDLQGHLLNGLPIYSPTLLKNLVQSLSVTDVLLATPSASRQRRNEILDSARQAQVLVRTLPSFIDLAEGHIHLIDLREVDIENLLGRNAVPPNASMLDKNVRNKVVLVTGTGGSIGSELCRQIIKLAPSKLLLLELSEFSLYDLHQDLLQLLSAEVTLEVHLIK